MYASTIEIIKMRDGSNKFKAYRIGNGGLFGMGDSEIDALTDLLTKEKNRNISY